jgi:homoserine O-acetyltransferase/O-succinyltransferase
MKIYSSQFLRGPIVWRVLFLGFLTAISVTSLTAQTPQQGDFSVANFRFSNGQQLPSLRLHYTTFGRPVRDARGHVLNAVLILHGTSGSGAQFLSPQFHDVLFQPGQLLDASKYFIILPDDIGHGKSSKPSDGLHARFPEYGYHDMVTAEYRLVTEGLHVDHLRLVMGTSMGCMHSWMWGEEYPDTMDALMPLACLPIPIAGRNRIWRKMLIDAIRNDPQWMNGDYQQQPHGLITAFDMLIIAGSSALQMQKNASTPQLADEYLAHTIDHDKEILDANDLLYAVASSRDYDPSKDLEKIQAPVMYINSADDFINPPELGIAQQEITRVKRGRFVLIPISDETRGHGTHTRANVWKQYLAELLQESAH